MQNTAKAEKKGMFSSKIFDSRIQSSNTTGLEKGLGYFAGPAMVFMAYYCIAGSYLTQFYTDVLGLTGAFITFMPLISKIVDALTNICMGRIIDKTRSRQGKARPWILISGPILLVSGILLYAVPQASANVQILWVVFSYNLFFAFAFTIYNMSHTLMVPLSTRNTRQRDTLAHSYFHRGLHAARFAHYPGHAGDDQPVPGGWHRVEKQLAFHDEHFVDPDAPCHAD